MTPKKYILPLAFSFLLISGILIGNWYGTNYSKTNPIPSLFNKMKQGDNGDLSFSLHPATTKSQPS